jgi:integrative and conjugative element protein (TIGR02256 family)
VSDHVFYLGESFVELPMQVDIALRTLYYASSIEYREYYAGLFGSYSKDGRLVTIKGVMSVRVGKEKECARDHVALAESCQLLWGLSNGSMYFIGDWHTHPNALSEPSAVDLRTLSESRTEQTVSPLMLISGVDGYSLRGLIGDDILAGELRP